MDRHEKKNKRTGLISSLLIHALLLVLFIFFGLTSISPPPEEGMMINFGDAETGLGAVESEPVRSSEPVKEPVIEEEKVTEPVSQTVQENEVTEEVVTQEMLEAIALQKAEQKRKQEEADRKAEEEKRQAEEARIRAEKKAASDALFAKARPGRGTGEGDTRPRGNQGQKDGIHGTPHGGHGGSGNGPSFNLGGRSMLAAPRIEDTSQKEGKVVVDIVVDKYGKVVKATPGARGSTTADPHLEKLAKDAAYDTRFNKNPDAPIQQKGTMTFVFILE